MLTREEKDPFLLHYGHSLVKRLTDEVIKKWNKKALKEGYAFFVPVFTGDPSFVEYDVYFLSIQKEGPVNKDYIERLVKNKLPSAMYIIEPSSFGVQCVNKNGSFFINDK